MADNAETISFIGQDMDFGVLLVHAFRICGCAGTVINPLLRIISGMDKTTEGMKSKPTAPLIKNESGIIDFWETLKGRVYVSRIISWEILWLLYRKRWMRVTRTEYNIPLLPVGDHHDPLVIEIFSRKIGVGETVHNERSLYKISEILQNSATSGCAYR